MRTKTNSIHHILVPLLMFWLTAASGQNFKLLYRSLTPNSSNGALYSFCNNNEGYCIPAGSGGDHWAVRKTTDGGLTWNNTSFQISPSPIYSSSFQIFCPAPNLVYVNTYKSLDGGQTWYEVFPGAVSVSFVNSFTGYALKDNKLWKTTNGGGEWSIVNPSLNGIYITHRGIASKLLVLTNNQQCLVSEDGGTTFTSHSNFSSLPAGLSGYTINVKFFNENQGTALFTAGVGLSKILSTSNGGRSWFVPSADCQLRVSQPNLQVFPNGTGYASLTNFGSLCSSIPYTTYKSTDFGASWAPVNVLPGTSSVRQNLIYAFDQNTVVSTDQYKSTDGGNSWSDLVPYFRDSYVWDFEAINSNQRIVRLNKPNPVPGNPDSWITVKTTNNGISWFEYEPMVESLNPPLNPQYLFNSNASFRLNSLGLYYSTNSGADWIKVGGLPSELKHPDWSLIETPSNDRVILFNRSLTNNQLRTIDVSFGGNFATGTVSLATRSSGGDLPPMTNFSFSDELNGIAFSGNQLYKTSDGGSTWAQHSQPSPIPSPSVPGKVKLATPTLLYYSRLENAGTSKAYNAIYKFNLLTNEVSEHIIEGGSLSLLDHNILDFDIVGEKGIAITCRKAIYETSNGWATSEKKSPATICNTFFPSGIGRPRVKTIGVGAAITFVFNGIESGDNLNSLRAGSTIESRFFDKDGDGFFGSGLIYNAFTPPSSPPFTSNGGIKNDCDDFNPLVKPSAPDASCDGVDNNCNFTIDEDAAFVTYYWDGDADGLGDALNTQSFCTNPGGRWVRVGNDCNDADPAVGGPIKWYADSDSDGFGDPISFVFDCNNPSFPNGLQYVRNNNDCNDADPLINPRRFEIPGDGMDNDCDGQVDEGTDPEGTTYCDLDDDGFGDPGCPIPPAGLRVSKNGQSMILTEGVPNNTDCDDTNPALNPFNFESANSMDDDCDGLIDDGAGTATWYFDGDSDGFGSDSITIVSETQVPGYVAISGDCDDTKPSVNPGAEEICGNETDDNCNGLTDENNPVFATPLVNREFCAGTNSPAVSFQSNASAQWFNSNPTIGLAASGTGLFLPAFTASNTGNLPVIAIVIAKPYRLNTNGSECFGSSDTFRIKVNPKPAVSAGSDVSITTGESTTLVATGAQTYSWTPVTSLNPSNGTGASVVASPILTTLYTVTGTDANNCSNTDQVLVTVTGGSGPLTAPLISPGTGTYGGPQNVTLTSTPGATIYYTTTGNNPVIGTSFTREYTGPFQVIQTATIRAMAVRAGSANSPVAAAFITITNPGIVATPVLSPGGSSFEGSVTVSLTTQTPEAEIWYTTNGNLPRLDIPNSFTFRYTAPFTLFRNATVRAIGIKAGLLNSAIAVANYVVNNPAVVATPTFSPGPGAYASAQTVTINCATPNAQIYFTNNGMAPSNTNPAARLYSVPFIVGNSAPIKAIAYRAGFHPSVVSVGNYTIGPGRLATDQESDAYYFESQEFESERLSGTIHLMPNPTTGRFFIETEQTDEEASLSVLNTMGQTIWQGNKEIGSHRFEIDITQQPAGIYLVRYRSKSLSKDMRITRQ